ncbi:hypothetical protein Tco_0846622 [Tanacetum coccineum]
MILRCVLLDNIVKYSLQRKCTLIDKEDELPLAERIVADVLSDYLGGLDEDVIKDNFVTVYHSVFWVDMCPLSLYSHGYDKSAYYAEIGSPLDIRGVCWLSLRGPNGTSPSKKICNGSAHEVLGLSFDLATLSRAAKRGFGRAYALEQQ